jgi:hypothetical protein
MMIARRLRRREFSGAATAGRWISVQARKFAAAVLKFSTGTWAHISDGRQWARLLAVFAVIAVAFSLLSPSLVHEPTLVPSCEAPDLTDCDWRVGVDQGLANVINSYPNARDNAFAVVVIHLLNLDPDNRVAKASVRITLATRSNEDPTQWPKVAVSWIDGSVWDSDHGGRLDPQHADDKLTLYLYPNRATTLNISVKLADLINKPFKFDIPVEIPATTSSADFPQDRWVFDFGGWMDAPFGLSISAEGHPGQIDLPVVLAVVRDDRLQQWILHSAPPVGTESEQDVGNTHIVGPPLHVHAVLSRPINVWLFVYTIGLAPLVLALAYFVSRPRGTVGENATALSLAAALLSLLTIRQVVTPGNIQGITRLDRLLGIELVSVIALFAFTTTATSPEKHESVGSIDDGEAPKVTNR